MTRTSKGAPIRREQLVDMAETLVHRGPDDEGYVTGDGFGFAFRRLAIIGLVDGNQPMSNEDGSIHLVANGEIFNYKELRAELTERGHVFRSQTDVEVLVHLYEEMGCDLVKRLEGQFGFAIYDTRHAGRERLLLARDPFGVVPMFHTTVQSSETLIFASEIKAILAHPGVERRVDLTGLDQIFSLPGLVSPRTMFEGIHSLPPGHVLIAEGGSIRTHSYWDIDYPREDQPSEPPRADVLDELEHLLLRAVERRLQADVPVGAYLSGGLDSSLIASMMAKFAPGARTTFSMGFSDPTFTERKYQAIASKALGLPHEQIEFDTADIERRMAEVIWHCECPLKESYNTASFALSRAAHASGVKVVLTGEGADELFAGYPSYRFDAMRRRTRREQPVSIEEREIRCTLYDDPEFFYERDQSAFKANKLALFSRRVGERYADFDFTRFPLVPAGRLSGRHPVHKRSYLDFKLRLADHLVGDHGDRMLMASSVEGRYPFLDVALVEFCRRLPPDLKLQGFKEKFLLKKLGERYLPAEIFAREKFGFVAPGTPHLLEEKIDWVEDRLSPAAIARQGYFDPAAVEDLKRRYGAPGFALDLPVQEDLLMIVLTFSLFVEQFGLPSA